MIHALLDLAWEGSGPPFELDAAWSALLASMFDAADACACSSAAAGCRLDTAGTRANGLDTAALQRGRLHPGPPLHLRMSGACGTLLALEVLGDAAAESAARLAERSTALAPQTPPAPAAPEPRRIDAEALRRRWMALQTPECFQAMLADLSITGSAAARAASPDLAEQVDPGAVARLLAGARSVGAAVEICCAPMTVRHTRVGAIERVRADGVGVEATSTNFRFRAATADVAETWVL
ncbi:MAG: hypothetical protein AAFR16_08595, partial [Pseudomonadota bacterium]